LRGGETNFFEERYKSEGTGGGVISIMINEGMNCHMATIEIEEDGLE